MKKFYTYTYKEGQILGEDEAVASGSLFQRCSEDPFCRRVARIFDRVGKQQPGLNI